MKIKCVMNCNGVGYEDFNVGEERDIEKQTAKMLVDFGYAIETTTKKPKPDGNAGGG